MKLQTIGLCMIVKDEEENIDRAIASVADNVDAIYLTDTGSTDKTVEVAVAAAKRYKVPIFVSHFEWVDDFAKARNFNFEQAKTDWILWIDADDTVERANALRTIVERAAKRGNSALALWYRYWVDNQGRDKTGHNKVRLVKRDMYEWTLKAPIHENLFIKPEFEDQKMESYVDMPIIRHWAGESEFLKSSERNLRILRALLERERKEGKEDPRTVFLLGREYHAGWRLSQKADQREFAIKFLEQYLDMVNSGGDRLQACSLLCEIYADSGHYDEVEKYAYEGIKAHPSHPLGYVLVARTYSYRGESEQVLNWTKQARERKISPTDGTVHTPKGIQREVCLLEAEAYKGLEKYDEAEKAIREYLDIAEPGEVAELEERVDYLQAETQAQKILNGFVALGNTALTYDRLENIKPLIEIIPASLAHRRQVLALKRRVGLMKVWAKGSIVVWCGPSFEPWDESNLEKGMGGSETAVVEQAKRWGKAGYKVVVYNSVTERKIYGNVEYVPFGEINLADEFDIFFSWRNPIFASAFNVLARHKFLWMHDVPNALAFDNEVIGSYEKIILLSQHHATFIPAVPKEKIYFSSNGIDVALIEEVEKESIERKPHKIIYASSPDRGLENLLDVLPKVKEVIPDIEVVWAYGWDTFDALRKDPASIEWKKKMQDRMAELGVKELGRLGKRELIREYFSAGIWAYPTQFDEINCIVAQEAQASGCYPVCTNFAALKEVVTLTGGKVEKLEDFADKLIHHLQFNTRTTTDYIKECREKFGWDVTAANWMRDLFYGVEFEEQKPLVSVICITIRPGIFRVLKETLAKQTYQNFELVVVDGRYGERAGEVAEYMKDVPYPFIHVPDPERDRKKYPYGLFHADNAAIQLARGELFVFLQDFILMPDDGIEKFVEQYKVHPDALITGVDTRNAMVFDHSDRKEGELVRSIDIAYGREYTVGEEQFRSPRIRLKGARRLSWNPYEWELNYAAASRKTIIETLGGFQQDWDKGFAFDNTEVTLRHLYLGGYLVVDETNLATAISHWDIFGDNDSEGVPDRNKKPNDERFANYQEYLSQRGDVIVKQKIKKPKFDPETYKRVKKWKKDF